MFPDQDKRIIVVLVSAALILRIALLLFGLFAAGQEYFFSFDDARGYFSLAQNLAEGRGYTVNYSGVEYPETGRTPGYPLLIALSMELFRSAVPLVVLQLAMGSILPILAYLLTLRLFAHRLAAIAAAAFFAFDPLVIALATLLMTETIFMTLFIGALLIFLRAFDGNNIGWRPLAIAGLLFSFATELRPVLLYALPVLAIYLMYMLMRDKITGRAIAAFIVFVAATSTFIFPWMARNYKQAGIFELTSLSGTVAYFYAGSSILSIAEGKSFNDARQELRAIAKATGIAELRDPKNTPYFKKEAMRIVREHPKETALLAGFSIFHLMTHDGYLDTSLQTGILKSAPQSVPQISAVARGEFGKLLGVAKQFLKWPWLIFIIARLVWIAITALAFIGMCYTLLERKRDRPQMLMVLGILIAITLATLPVALGMHGRLRIPMDVFIIPLTVIGWQTIYRALRKAP